jgi:hypothetical protein
MSNLEGVLREITCQKSVGGAEFPQGVQIFNWSIGGRTAFVPRKSYFRIEVELKNRAGGVTVETPLPKNKYLALADNFCGNLYNNAYFRMGGQDVSSITSFLPQASILKARLDKSGAWQNQIGESVNFLDPWFESRQDKTMLGGGGFAPKRDTRPVGPPGATIEIKTGGLIGVNTTLFTAPTKLEVGDVIVAGGVEYVCTAAPTNNLGAGSTIVRVDGLAVADVAATANAYIIKNSSANSLFVMWQPPIGIFDEDKPLGSGDYRLELNPNQNYKTAVMQSFQEYLPGTADSYEFNIKNVRFYAYTIKDDLSPSGTDILHLTEMALYQKTSQGATSNLEFTVPSSTQALSVFVQSAKTGSLTTLPPSRFKLLDDSEEDMRSLQLTYGNVTKPSVQWDSQKLGYVDRLQQRYHDMLLESGQLWDVGGSESFEAYLYRGMHNTYAFVRDKDDRSTQVSLRMNFGSGTAVSAPSEVNIVICAHYQRTVSVTTDRGFVTDVQSMDT